ncbi:hypothetical protein ABZ479_35330 [Streptomyces sp. NPDC005722]
MSTPLLPHDRPTVRRRSRTGLLLQFVLQWFWLPVWAALAAALGVLAALASAGLNPPLKWLNPWLGVLTWPRLRIEWAWDAAAWEAYATEKIHGRIDRAEGHPAAYKSGTAADGGLELAVTVPARLFRGVGQERAKAMAGARGWSAEARSTGREQWSPGALRLTRTVGPAS